MDYNLSLLLLVLSLSLLILAILLTIRALIGVFRDKSNELLISFIVTAIIIIVLTSLILGILREL